MLTFIISWVFLYLPMLKSLILYLHYSIKSDPKMMKHLLFKPFFTINYSLFHWSSKNVTFWEFWIIVAVILRIWCIVSLFASWQKDNALHGIIPRVHFNNSQCSCQHFRMWLTVCISKINKYLWCSSHNTARSSQSNNQLMNKTSFVIY